MADCEEITSRWVHTCMPTWAVSCDFSRSVTSVYGEMLLVTHCTHSRRSFYSRVITRLSCQLLSLPYRHLSVIWLHNYLLGSFLVMKESSYSVILLSFQQNDKYCSWVSIPSDVCMHFHTHDFPIHMYILHVVMATRENVSSYGFESCLLNTSVQIVWRDKQFSRDKTVPRPRSQDVLQDFAVTNIWYVKVW